MSFNPEPIINIKRIGTAWTWFKSLSLFFVGASLLAQAPLAAAAKRNGKSIFALCVSCHGDAGEGRQNLSAPAIAGMPEWYLISQLNKFKNGNRGNHAKDFPGLKMRPMAKMLRYEGDVEVIAKYVSGLKTVKPPQTITDGNAASGATHYATCAACHGPDGKGMQPLNAPPLVGQNDWYLKTQLHNFKTGLRGANAEKDATGATMAPMANMLVDDQAERDVLAHIYSLQ